MPSLPHSPPSPLPPQVSRKALLDPQASLPDALKATGPDPTPAAAPGASGHRGSGGGRAGGAAPLGWNALPSFPVTPPKRFSKVLSVPAVAPHPILFSSSSVFVVIVPLPCVVK